MDFYQCDDGFHSDGTVTPPHSYSSNYSIISTSDHGSLESVEDDGIQRTCVLSFEQIRKLHEVMCEKISIHGRGNFPTIEVALKDLVTLVRKKLESDISAGGAEIIVKDIRLNGGAASHVVAQEDQPYNDLDLIFAVDLSSPRMFDRIKSAVLNTLIDLLPDEICKRRIYTCSVKEAYVGKMVKVNNNNDGDRWSLISLGNSPGHKNVELKFVDTMRRQFEFSVDSFQIVLDSLFSFYDCAALLISENFYPTVIGESVYGDFQEAMYHLQHRLISTRQPEEIRGGGLLKYCNLLVRNYKAIDPQRIKTLERYMCSRFFIDFPDINSQASKLIAYLRNHFWGAEEEPLQFQYLMHLGAVVETSTVCLMGHERRQTLHLIRTLATRVLYKDKETLQIDEQQYHPNQRELNKKNKNILSQQQQRITSSTETSTHDQQQQLLLATTQAAYLPPPLTNNDTLNDNNNNNNNDMQTQSSQLNNYHDTTTTSGYPRAMQLQTSSPPSLIYANGVYYAPVIPAAVCTCNSNWLRT